jgi:hypothetical protein
VERLSNVHNQVAGNFSTIPAEVLIDGHANFASLDRLSVPESNKGFLLPLGYFSGFFFEEQAFVSPVRQSKRFLVGFAFGHNYNGRGVLLQTALGESQNRSSSDLG